MYQNLDVFFEGRISVLDYMNRGYGLNIKHLFDLSEKPGSNSQKIDVKLFDQFVRKKRNFLLKR